MKHVLALLAVVPVFAFGQEPVRPAAPAAPEPPKAPAAEPVTPAPARTAPPAAPAAPAETAPAAKAPAAKDIAVAEAKVGTGVEGLELQGEAASFPASVEKVYCWTRITGGAGQEVIHAWYKDGAKVAEVKLGLRFASVRTYSYKNLGAEPKGAWKVDVLGPDGTVLKTVEFKVE
jgi:hypothetical protein